MLKKKGWKSILLLTLVVTVTFVLSSCNFHFTVTGTLPTTPVESILVVKSGGSWIYGYIHVNDVDTGIYLNSYQTKKVYNVPCYQNVKIRLVDENYFFSHTEYIYTKPGLNYVNFDYWW